MKKLDLLMKRVLITVVILLGLLTVAVVGGSFYMLDYSLAPAEGRSDTARSFRQLVKRHPETSAWLDSLRACGGLRDTFVLMPSGERHHAYFLRSEEGRRVAVVLHGWRGDGVRSMHIGRIYEQAGCNVLMPDLHAHGLSDGEAIGMGWGERLDVLQWMKVAARLFVSGDFIVHGVSMGAATAMNVSGEEMPAEVSTVRFIEDCGYTSVWDEFHYEMGEEFGLPDFPLLYASSLLCKLRYGWSFGEASPLAQVRKSRYPMLFVHGDADDFVPSRMVHPLYEAKGGEKQLWVTRGTAHARSYSDYPEEYVRRVRDFSFADGGQAR